MRVPTADRRWLRNGGRQDGDDEGGEDDEDAHIWSQGRGDGVRKHEKAKPL